MKDINHYLKVTVLKSNDLQVPFPALNELLPGPSGSVGQVQGCSSQVYALEQTIVDSGSKPEDVTQTNLPAVASLGETTSIAEQFLAVLEEAVSIRVRNASPLRSCQSHAGMIASVGDGKESRTCSCIPPLPDDCASLVYGQAKIGLLFSGGVDSVVLAALVDR